MATIFRSGPNVLKVALALLALGTLLFLIGFCTVSWMKGICVIDRSNLVLYEAAKSGYVPHTDLNDYNRRQNTNYKHYTNNRQLQRDLIRGTCTNGLWDSEQCIRAVIRGAVWTQNICKTFSHSNINLPGYHRTIRAMECLCLVLEILALVTLLLYFVFDNARKYNFLVTATNFVFIGAACSVVGFAMYGASREPKNRFGFGLSIGWSMGLAIAGSAVNFVAGILMASHTCKQ